MSDKEIESLNKKIGQVSKNEDEEGGKGNIPKQEKINEVIFEEIKSYLLKKEHVHLLDELINQRKKMKSHFCCIT
ncbi:MAG: hypothetical protein ACP5HC_07990 [Caldisericum sp.]